MFCDITAWEEDRRVLLGSSRIMTYKFNFKYDETRHHIKFYLSS